MGGDLRNSLWTLVESVSHLTSVPTFSVCLFFSDSSSETVPSVFFLRLSVGLRCFEVTGDLLWREEEREDDEPGDLAEDDRRDRLLDR